MLCVHCFIKEFTNLSALLRLKGWGVGRAEEGWVSLALGNKQAGLDWPPVLSLWIHCGVMRCWGSQARDGHAREIGRAHV